jgi:hypothetical protein
MHAFDHALHSDGFGRSDWLSLFIEDRFNTVPIRIENESGKIIRTMFRM